MSKQTLIVDVYMLVRLVVDDFTGDVDKQDVMSLSDDLSQLQQ